MARRAKLDVEINGDNRGFAVVARSTETLANKLSGNIKNAFLGVFSVNAALRFGRELVEQVRTIDELATKYRITTTEVQMLQSEARRTHKDFEDLVDTSAKLEENLAKVRERGAIALFDPASLEAIRQFDATVEGAKDKGKAEAGGILSRAQSVMTHGNWYDILSTFFTPVGAVNLLRGASLGAKLDQGIKDDQASAVSGERLLSNFLTQDRKENPDPNKRKTKLPEDKKDPDKLKIGIPTSGDSLARIGGFIGGTSGLGGAMQVVKKLDEIQKLLVSRGVKIQGEIA